MRPCGDSISLTEGKNLIMTDRIETAATTINYSHLDRLAQIMERIGLAIVGALCGFFVAALVAKANIMEINSIGVLLSVILYGSVGFYLGTNIPSLPSGTPYRALADVGSVRGTNPLMLVSATGTFLTTLAALVSVYLIVFDEVPAVVWIIGIGFCWTLGVLLQLVAGAAARLEQITGVTG
jgi:hypothetical protein